MSAETLRRAAALMRERADAASERISGDPFAVRVDRAVSHGMWQPHAELACSWRPAVALAVADLLDRAADDHDETPCPAVDATLAVALAYLGEES